MGTYEDVFRASTEDPESFWLKAAQGIDWDVTPRRA
ncbi:acetyl-coenzyme A synthetase N-terminal domain-containing protein, partial [Streptomyces canus]